MPHESTYLRLLREWAQLDQFPYSCNWARVRKIRIGCLVLRLERLARVRQAQ